MKGNELIPVYVRVGKNGMTKCICARYSKGCDRACDEDYVTRDRFRGWKDVMNQDKYGRSRDAPLPKEIKKMLKEGGVEGCGT